MRTEFVAIAFLAVLLAAPAASAAPVADPDDPAVPPPADRGTISGSADDADRMVVTPPGAENSRGPGSERVAGQKEGRRAPRGSMPPPPPPSNAATFEIENGGFRFRVKCAENEPMQVCADIASKLLGEAKGLVRP